MCTIDHCRLATATAIALAAMVVAPADASFPGRNGRIALAGGLVAFTARADGTGFKRIPGKLWYPQWSADGRSLIFLRPGGVIWRSRPTGSHATEIVDPRLVPAPGRWPWRGRESVFSPDGEQVFFTADAGLGTGVRAFSIFRVGKDGSDVLRLYDGAVGLQSPAWSPNGTLIAFTSGTGSIATIRPDGTDFRVRLARRSTVITNLDFSPDGRQLLYVSERITQPHHPAHIKVLTRFRRAPSGRSSPSEPASCRTRSGRRTARTSPTSTTRRPAIRRITRRRRAAGSTRSAPTALASACCSRCHRPDDTRFA
jgi:hypothetical protein